MPFRRLLPLLSMLGLTTAVACFDDKDDDDEDEDDSGSDPGWGTTGSSTVPTGTTTGTDQSIMIDWGASAIEIDVAPGDDYLLGLAETGACDDCWTGEDCIYGYSFDGSILLYCHDVPAGHTRLTYGGDPLNLSPGTTVFPDDSHSSRVTYFLEASSGGCWVWGNDTSYYDGLGCSNL